MFDSKEFNVNVLTENDCCKQVNIEATIVEWLVILKALKSLVNAPDVNEQDKKVAEGILNTEPIIEEDDNV